jgi:hypothetical protein
MQDTVHIVSWILHMVITNVVSLQKVVVYRADGTTLFEGTINATKTVFYVKTLVQAKSGISIGAQLMHVVGAENGDTSVKDTAKIGDLASDSDVLEIHLIVSGPQIVSAGDATTISGPGSCTITQQNNKYSLCMTDLVATAGGGAVYGEFKVLSGDKFGRVSAAFGAVVPKDGLDLDKRHTDPDNDEAYFMDLMDGSLYGSGKRDSDSQGVDCVSVGDRMGVLVKAGPEGFVRFFKNSEAFGSTFSSPIQSTLVVVVQMGNKGVSLELLPNAVAPCANE